MEAKPSSMQRQGDSDDHKLPTLWELVLYILKEEPGMILGAAIILLAIAGFVYSFNHPSEYDPMEFQWDYVHPG